MPRCYETVRARRLAEYAVDGVAGEEKALTRLLAKLGDLNASDPRDKIFAVLGMSNEQNEEGFAADYTKAMEEVYL
jgi:hypothetical protein